MNLPRDQAELYAAWFRCLANPTRLAILNLLARERRALSVSEIVSAVEVGQSTVSAHLRLLAEMRFVLVEHRGTTSLFQINANCIECFPSAAEFVMGNVRQDRLPSSRPGRAVAGGGVRRTLPYPASLDEGSATGERRA